jgi:hypothetical protein
MRYLRYLSLAGIVAGLCLAASKPMSASPLSVGGNLSSVMRVHAQIVVGWHNGRYWDGNRYWRRREWYAAHPGWNGGWGPGWNYHPGVVVAGPGISVGWYNGRYWDGHRYWDRDGWYRAHPGWRGGWGPGWHYRR